MQTLTMKEVENVSGGWGALDECTPKYGFDPKTQDCFDGGPIPKRDTKPGTTPDQALELPKLVPVDFPNT